MRRLACVLTCFLLAGCSTGLLHSSVVLDTDSTQLPPGQVVLPGAWTLKYSWDCSRQAVQGISQIDRFDLVVYNDDDFSTNFEHPELHLTGRRGGGTLDFKRGGAFKPVVDTPCDWTLKVTDVSSG